MAKKKIDKNDIAPKDLFDNIKKGADETKEKILALKTAIDALNSSAKKIKGGVKGAKATDTKGMRDFDALTKQANATATAKLKIDKQLIHQKEHLRRLQSEQNKEVKATIELRKTEVGSLNRVRAESKKLAIEKGKVNRLTKSGARRLKEINRQLDKNNKILDKNATKLGKQKNNIGNYGSAIGKLTGMLGKLGLAFGVFALIRNAFTTIKDFEQAQANLASVLGVSTLQMEGLTKQSMELGAVTRFTASEVSELQLQLAKLGFSQKQIEGMTESVLALAGATGAELGEAATVVGSAMRAFGLTASDTKRITDVMSKSFSTSSLDMTKFSTSMAVAAPVAKALGFSIEETTALIGTMTDSGIDASTAGTGLRNMMLDAKKAGLTLDEALAKVAVSSDKVGTSFDLFGKRGATLGVILASNRDRTAELTGTLDFAAAKFEASDFLTKAKDQGFEFDDAMEQIRKSTDKAGKAQELFGERLGNAAVSLANTQTDANGLTEAIDKQKDATQEMADKQLNTLGGALDLMKSAWDGYILKLNQAGGIGEKLRHGIGFLADNLGLIIGVIMKVVRAFIIYKATMAALNLKEKISDFIDFKKSIKGTKDGMKDATPAVKGFGKALKGIGFAIAIAALVELALAWHDVASGASRARKEAEMYGKVSDKASEAAAKFTDDVRHQMQTEQNITNKLLAAKKISEKEAVKRHAKTLKRGQERIDLVIKEKRIEKNQALADKKIAKAKLKDLESQLGFMEKHDSILSDLEKDIERQKNVVAKTIATEKAWTVVITELKEESKGLTQSIVESDIELTGLEATTTKHTGTVKKANAEFKESIDLLDALNEQYNDLLDVQQEIRSVELEQQITNLNDVIESKLLTAGLNVAAGISPDIAPIEKLLNERKELEIKGIEERRDIEIAEAEKTHDAKFKDMRDNLREETAELLAQENLTKAQKVQISEQFLVEIGKIDALELDAEEKLKLDIILSEKKAKNEILDIRKSTRKEIENAQKIQTDFDEEERKKATAAEIDAEKKRLADLARLKKESLDFIQKLAIKNIDERIKKIEEESEAHKKKADFLRELAKNGNISAKESLAEQNRIIAEAEAEKERLEKRKQRVLLVSSILQAYNAELAIEGTTSVEALTKAITSKVVLDQFIAGIGSFFDGTEDTGLVSNGMDSNGGRLAVLHNNERVMTAKQNAKIGDYTNDQVARIVEERRLGNIVGDSQIGNGWDSHLVVQELMEVSTKLDQVNKTIENKETNRIELGEITQSAMKIVETRKKGLNRTVSTYKIQ